MAGHLWLILLDGSNRRAVGDSRTAGSGATRARRREGSTVDALARGAERDPMGDAHGSAVEGHAEAISSVRDVPSSLQRLGARWHAAHDR
jgi:hypothetical protein